MIATDPDPLLNRVQRDTTVVCAALVLVATVAGGWRAAFGVVAGGLVVFVSYRGIKAGIDGLVAEPAPAGAVALFPRRKAACPSATVAFIASYAGVTLREVL